MRNPKYVCAFLLLAVLALSGCNWGLVGPSNAEDIPDAPQVPSDEVSDDISAKTKTTRCTNNTGEVILVYSNNSLYILHSGYTTATGFDCDGVFIPTDRFIGYGHWGARAVKYYDYIPFTVSKVGSQYNITGGWYATEYWNPDNNPYSWYIPNWSSSVYQDW